MNELAADMLVLICHQPDRARRLARATRRTRCRPGANGIATCRARNGACASLGAQPENGTVSRVLLADDDQDLRNALQTVLADAGHNVTVASNGLEESTTRREGHLKKPFDPAVLLETIARLALESDERSGPAWDVRAAQFAGLAALHSQRGAEEDTKRLVRALMLVGEQAQRVRRLQSRGAASALAIELHQNLIEGLVALAAAQRCLAAIESLVG